MKYLMIIGIIELCFLALRLIIGAVRIALSDNETGFGKLINTVETIIAILALYVLIVHYYNS